VVRLDEMRHLTVRLAGFRVVEPAALIAE